ncbi:hypothetical protein [Bosea sp. RAC05]|uniref:hypothetical protein n=1 Tax=Bosea sp. RAC05 TaxID=1842539 RepID=UPI00083DE47E|nr:hypothetical protein [Bosea sp. RAC05]AOG03039.1 putative membrane protein [Bosea sp. RAC05]
MRHVVAALAWLMIAAFLSPGMAQQGCGSLSVEPFVKNVPFFGTKMTPVRSTSPEVLSFVHPDDARLAVSFFLRARTTAVESRSDFLQNLRSRLDAEVASRRAGGAVVESGIFPYDPVAWTVATRSSRQDGADVSGELVIRLTATCQLVASWNVYETSVLAKRITEITNALDAVRLLSVRLLPASEFLPDRRIPSGPSSLIFGFFGPLAAAGVIIVLLRGWLNYDRPGLLPRIISGAGAVVGVYAILVQSPVYREAIEQFRYIDSLLLTGCATLLLLIAVVSGNQKTALTAYAASLCAGLSLGVSAWFGWSPVDAIAPSLSAFFVFVGFFGLLLWGMQARPTGIRGMRTAAAAR